MCVWIYSLISVDNSNSIKEITIAHKGERWNMKGERWTVEEVKWREEVKGYSKVACVTTMLMCQHAHKIPTNSDISV